MNNKNSSVKQGAGRVLRPELRSNPGINVASVDGNVLATILNAKVDYLAQKKLEQPLESFKDSLTASQRDFYGALTQKHTVFILECKKASPSKGLIRPDFNPASIAGIYKNYASAISVLADEPFFQGKYEYIAEVSQAVDIPVLCKDFIYDPYQVYLARKNGADAILLMLSVLTDEAYTELRSIAHSLGMGVLTEASQEEEIRRAIALDARIIGINNRNLRTLTVDLNQVRRLSQLVPEDRVIISESGIYTHAEVLNLRHYANGFLVGSSLTAENDIDRACRRLIYGENKVCGITTVENALSCYKAGFVYNGLIFAEKSPRYISPERAKELIHKTRTEGGRQDFVGVFVNKPAMEVALLAKELELSVIQLHGSEDEAYIEELSEALTLLCGEHDKKDIWKAVPVSGDEIPMENIRKLVSNPLISRVLLDSGNNAGFGGTGTSFDWQKLTGTDAGLAGKLIVAGGLTDENARKARDLCETAGLDFNSGLETAPGIKDPNKILSAMNELKNY